MWAKTPATVAFIFRWTGCARPGSNRQTFLARPVFSEALGSVVKRLLDIADELYQRAESGIARLPVGCRPGIYAARLLYAEIGREVARNGYDSVSQRAIVPKARKVAVLSQALAATPFPGGDYKSPALPENGFLIDAVAAVPVQQNSPPGPRPLTGACEALAKRWSGWLNCSKPWSSASVFLKSRTMPCCRQCVVGVKACAIILVWFACCWVYG